MVSPQAAGSIIHMRLARFDRDGTGKSGGRFAPRRGRAPAAELAVVCLALVFALALSLNALA